MSLQYFYNEYKYQLSLTKLHNELHYGKNKLQTKLDAQCDKLAIEQS